MPPAFEGVVCTSLGIWASVPGEEVQRPAGT